jgi:hypothetical protein
MLLRERLHIVEYVNPSDNADLVFCAIACVYGGHYSLSLIRASSWILLSLSTAVSRVIVKGQMALVSTEEKKKTWSTHGGK